MGERGGEPSGQLSGGVRCPNCDGAFHRPEKAKEGVSELTCSLCRQAYTASVKFNEAGVPTAMVLTANSSNIAGPLMSVAPLCPVCFCRQGTGPVTCPVCHAKAKQDEAN